MTNLSRKDTLKKVLLSIAFVALSLTAVFVYASAWPYPPADTLDPACNPGDVGCNVNPLWIKNKTDNFLTNIIDNVGIGTSTPSARLHVDGDGTIGSLVDALLLTVDGNEIMKVGRNDGIRFFDAYNFPTSDGTSGQVLMTDGLGVISWEDISSYAFGSGLTESAGVVNLGGTLTQSTTIDTGNNNFYVGSNTLGLGSTILEGYGTTLGGNYQLRLKTPSVYTGAATNGQVLRLLDASTGQVEFGTASSTNLYNTSGTLTGTRTIASGGNSLMFDGTGDITLADSGLLSSVGLTSTGALSQTGTSTFTGGMTLRPGNSFTFNNSANTFGTSFTAGNNTSNLSYTLPVVAPTAGQILSSDSNGVLSWESPGSFGTIGLSTGTTGTDVNVSGSPVSLGGTLTLNIPDASGTARGLITTGTQTIAGTKTFSSLISGSIDGNAATVTTNANLSGDVTSVGNTTTLGNAPVISKVLTGFTSGAGTVTASDSLLSAIQKLNGNIGLTSGAITSLTTPTGSNANGGSITSNALTLSFADGTNPGLLSTGTQTIAGTKTFSLAPLVTGFNQGGVVYSGLSGLLASTAAGTSGQVLTSNGTSAPTWQALSAWSTTGNSGTNANTNFVGTTDAQDLVFKVNNIQAGRINKTSGGTGNQIMFGNYAGDSSTNATATIFIGYGAGQQATNAQYSNFIGYNTGTSSSGASFSNFIGPSAGVSATNAANSNFFGYYAGNGATSAAYSTLIGFNAGRTFTGNNIGANNIIIGKHISLPNATANAINIGGVLFGTGTQSSSLSDPIITPTAGGKIGIGVVAPLDTLQVAGDIRTGTTGSNGCIKDFAGTGIVGTCSSDEELKTDIEDLPEISDKFSQVRFVTYKWNETAKEIYSNNTDVTNTGTIAQSVESQFPELVSRDDKGYRVVNYSGLLMYGMEAIKEVVSLADSFKEKLVSWFADAANNIELFIAGTIKARNELCVGETCINEAQLQQLLQNQVVSSSGGDSSSGDGTVTSDLDPVPEPAPALDPEPIPEPVPETVSE